MHQAKLTDPLMRHQKAESDLVDLANLDRAFGCGFRPVLKFKHNDVAGPDLDVILWLINPQTGRLEVYDYYDFTVM